MADQFENQTTSPAAAEANDLPGGLHSGPDRLATVAFVLGGMAIVSLLAVWCVPLNAIAMRVALFVGAVLCCIVGLPLGIVSLRRAKRRRGGGKSEARVGIATSAITLGLVVVFVLSVQAINSGYNKIYQMKCRANLRAIGQAMLLYASDNKGQFPQRLSELITHADVNPEVFLCAATPDERAVGPTTREMLADFERPGHCSYVYVGAGASVTSVDKTFVLAYEPLENHDKAGAHFIFGDSNVEWLEAGEAQKVIDQVKAGVNPPKR